MAAKPFWLALLGLAQLSDLVPEGTSFSIKKQGTTVKRNEAFSFSSGYKRFSSAMENKPYPRFYGCQHCFRRNTQQVSVSVFIYFPSVLFHAYH